MNFATKFRQIRKSKDLSTIEIAARVNMHKSTVSKAESGVRLPKTSTMRLICLKGLGLTERDPEFEELQALWVSERSGTMFEPAYLAKKLSRTALPNNKEAERFFTDVASLSTEDFNALAKAVRRPAVMAVLRATVALAESK